MGRILESEVMESEEAKVYCDAAAQQHLDGMDDAFVDKVATLGVTKGTLLDIGTGPAQIPIKFVRRTPEMGAVIVDLSQAMLRQARKNIFTAGLKAKFDILYGDAISLPFRDDAFELVICNSLIHHLADPIPTLNEIERVSSSGSAFMIRDLVRPLGPFFKIHASIFGRHYHGKMRELYENSLRAALTFGELKGLAKVSNLKNVTLFRLGVTHIGISRSTAMQPKAHARDNKELKAL